MREDGFYWIKWFTQDGEANPGEWEILYFDGEGRWGAAGVNYEYTDDMFNQIDERRIVFDEFEYNMWKGRKERIAGYTDISDK